jgi:hypothetical protein
VDPVAVSPVAPGVYPVAVGSSSSPPHAAATSASTSTKATIEKRFLKLFTSLKGWIT